MLFEKNNVE